MKKKGKNGSLLGDNRQHGERVPGSTGSLFHLVTALVKPYRSRLVLIFIAMIFEMLMSLAAGWPLKIILDNVVGKHKAPHWVTWIGLDVVNLDKMKLAAIAALFIVIIAIIGAVAAYLDNYFTESVAQFVADDLRQKIYHHLQKLSLPYFDRHQTGSLLSSITDDVNTIQGFATSSLMDIMVDGLTIVGMMALMLYLNWDFTLLALGITPFILFFVFYLKKAVKKNTRRVRNSQSMMVNILQQGLQSERSIKAFGRQELEEGKLKKASLDLVNSALKARSVKSLVSPVVAILISVCVGLVFWRGASLVLKGLMTAGALTVYVTYLIKFFKIVQNLAKVTTNVAQATVALERIQLILDSDEIIYRNPAARNCRQLKGDIAFHHVAFAYAQAALVLEDVHFTVRAGERVGICGPTGSGKSTIVSLIPRFYDPLSGYITIDGTNVTDYVLEDLRAQIGFVLQDTALFYGSIRENIAYGRPDASEEEIREAARLALADEFIMKMPDGYDSIVGERGATLSGGERQRIGIARAILRNAPILILDEPTAALDTKSEKLVMQALETLMKGKTVVTIAHRLSTIRKADRIIVLKDGVVAEEGKHETLMAAEGIYCELYRTQNEENSLPALAKN